MYGYNPLIGKILFDLGLEGYNNIVLLEVSGNAAYQ